MRKFLFAVALLLTLSGCMGTNPYDGAGRKACSVESR